MDGGHGTLGEMVRGHVTLGKMDGGRDTLGEMDGDMVHWVKWTGGYVHRSDRTITKKLKRKVPTACVTPACLHGLETVLHRRVSMVRRQCYTGVSPWSGDSVTPACLHGPETM